MKAARVVVLVVAVAAGGVAALLAGRSEKAPEAKKEAFDTVDILVAKSDIPRGKSISPADVFWQAWPAATAAGNFIRKTDKPKALDSLSGMIVRAPFVAGEPIREAKLVNAKGSGFMAAILPSGMRAVSTQISPETGAGGFILPNDRVDVILTPRGNRDAEKSSSETILRNIRVLAIDQNVEEKDGQKVVVGKTATLELLPSQAETLALSQQIGTLSLALRSIADGSDDSKSDDADSRRNININVVRFGVSTTTTPR
jgi:pilus assembly protein CpaB